MLQIRVPKGPFPANSCVMIKIGTQILTYPHQEIAKFAASRKRMLLAKIQSSLCEMLDLKIYKRPHIKRYSTLTQFTRSVSNSQLGRPYVVPC